MAVQMVDSRVACLVVQWAVCSASSRAEMKESSMAGKKAVAKAARLD